MKSLQRFDEFLFDANQFDFSSIVVPIDENNNFATCDEKNVKKTLSDILGVDNLGYLPQQKPDLFEHILDLAKKSRIGRIVNWYHRFVNEKYPCVCVYGDVVNISYAFDLATFDIENIETYKKSIYPIMVESHYKL